MTTRLGAWGRMAFLLVMGLSVFGVARAARAVDAYPTEAWPDSAGLLAKNGVTDSASGVPHIAKGTSPTSTVSLELWTRRQIDRLCRILAPVTEGRVVKVDSTHLGVFPLTFSIQGTDLRYAGTASTAITTTDDTYYVYLTDNGSGGGTLNVVTDATGWPLDRATYVPLAEVTVASAAIATITDVRNRLVYATLSAGAASSTGTDSTYFVLDQDNTSAGASSELDFNRGSTAADAVIRWNETNDRFDLLADGSAGAAVRASTFESTVSTGTAPFTVASTTTVTNLDADSVDGTSFLNLPQGAGSICWDTGAGVMWCEAPDALTRYLVWNGSGVDWQVAGSGSGIQAYDSDLDAVAGLAVTGLVARTASGAASARTLTASGSGITVTNGDGVAGNPTIAITGVLQYAVAVGSSAGLTSLTVPGDNTVLAGRSGNTPVFRKIVNDDMDATFYVEASQIEPGSKGAVLRVNAEAACEWSYPMAIWALPDSDTLTGGEVGKTLTNEGAAAQVVATLPPARAGLSYSFVVQDADGLRVQAGSGDTVRIAASVSAAAGYAECATIGNAVTFVAINGTEWVATSVVGTWTVN